MCNSGLNWRCWTKLQPGNSNTIRASTVIQVMSACILFGACETIISVEGGGGGLPVIHAHSCLLFSPTGQKTGPPVAAPNQELGRQQPPHWRLELKTTPVLWADTLRCEPKTGNLTFLPDQDMRDQIWKLDCFENVISTPIVQTVSEPCVTDVNKRPHQYKHLKCISSFTFLQSY